MGTNYYLTKLDSCGTCGHKPDDIHLGKHSGGWRFSIHGYRGDLPFGLPKEINSHRDMIDVVTDLLAVGWSIKDEYGTHISKGEFTSMMEASKTWNGKPSRSHYDYCKGEGYDMSNDIKDDEGWSVGYGEFS